MAKADTIIGGTAMTVAGDWFVVGDETVREAEKHIVVDCDIGDDESRMERVKEEEYLL